MKRLALIISRFFDPFVSLGAVFILLFYGSPQFIPAFFLMIALPLALFIIAWKTKFVSNWDVSDRRQRPKLLWTLLVIEVISSFVLQTSVGIPILIALFGFAVITNFWKMSGHAMAAALTSGMIVARFGWPWWPVFLIVPLVGWARVVRRDHTIWQVIAGAMYSWILIAVLTRFI